MTFLRVFLITLLAALLFAGAFAAGYLVHAQQTAGLNALPVFNQAYEILTQHGIKGFPPAPALEYGLIRGMVQAYADPYTVFIEPPQYELESNALQGRFGGIGVQIKTDSQGNWVLLPLPDSPALAAGIQEGDRLLAVGSLVVHPETALDNIQAAIRGPVDEAVDITIGRAPDYSPLQKHVVRAEFTQPSVTWYLDPDHSDVGVIGVSLIAATTAEEILNAVNDLRARGAQRFILDLRGNPGGLLRAGVDVARLFLAEGTVIEEEYLHQPKKTHQVEKPGPLADIPLVVLVDGNSASSAEIVAGAIKAHHRARLVGTPTFGKDTLQSIFELKDKSSLHVTSGRWSIPGLEPPVGAGGIQPDQAVETPQTNSGPDPVLQAGIRTLLETNK